MLSPSSANRWLNCTKSIFLEKDFEEEETTASKEGTEAHAFCEYKLKKLLGIKCEKPKPVFYNEEMENCTNDYVDFVMEQYEILKRECKDPLVQIEEEVDLSEYVPEGFGTADCILIGNNTLHIIDFKYGQGVIVDSYENPQMKCYALGALLRYEMLYDLKEVKMSIFQPRRENVSTFNLSVDELKKWADEVLKPKAYEASRGEGEYEVGDWCRFCKAKVICRKRAEENLKLAQEEFKLPPILSDEEIEEILSIIPNLTKWANDIMAYATDCAINHGKEWAGFKVVEGRSIRKYKDEEEVIKKATENGYTDIFKKSLITLTEMQKLMGKKKFEEILGDLIIKPKGKLTLVPNSDKRKKVEIDNNVNNEFSKETEGI